MEGGRYSVTTSSTTATTTTTTSSSLSSTTTIFNNYKKNMSLYIGREASKLWKRVCADLRLAETLYFKQVQKTVSHS
jgi:hypothetical protein